MEKVNLLRQAIRAIENRRKQYSTDPEFDDGIYAAIKAIEDLIEKYEPHT